MDKKQTINILQEAIIVYEKNLANKKILILYQVDKNVKYIEIIFKRSNFLHLTGLKIKNPKLNSRTFYKKTLNQRLSLNDFEINQNGTTKLKIDILNQISSINKFINMIGNYQANRKFLIANKVIGNLNVCLCLKKISDSIYIPISSLRENIKNITDKQYRIICIATKKLKCEQYNQITYLANNNTQYNTLEKINSLVKTIDLNIRTVYNEKEL